jgi:recombination protein RecR
MDVKSYPSKLLETAVSEFAKLPGIGRRTALRLVLHLIKQDPAAAESFGNAIIRLRNEIKYCRCCHNISDNDLCEICSNPSRNKAIICVVENIRDVMAIENTHQFNGLYHVLGGIISPMDGIGPADLNIESLENKLAGGEVKEVIFALSATMEGDTTNYYLYKKLCRFNPEITTIARGVSVGDDLEYADEITLGRSIANRTHFEASISN